MNDAALTMKGIDLKRVRDQGLLLNITQNGNAITEETLKGWGNSTKDRLFDMVKKVNGLSQEAEESAKKSSTEGEKSIGDTESPPT